MRVPRHLEGPSSTENIIEPLMAGAKYGSRAWFVWGCDCSVSLALCFAVGYACSSLDCISQCILGIDNKCSVLDQCAIVL